MKKSISIFVIAGILIVFGCTEKKDGNKNQEKNSSTTTKEDKKQQDSIYVPDAQKTEKINNNDRYNKKYKLKPAENNFNIANDNISVVIPVTDANMKIVEVFNVSDYTGQQKLNAIVIHLSNGSNVPTSDTITHKITSDLEISKIAGLSKTHLKDGKLKVYIINEDVLDEKERSAFITCASNETDYSEKTCDLETGEPQKGEGFRPREQEGDIITGG